MEIKFRPQDQNPTIQSHHRNNLTLQKPYLDLDKERGKMIDGTYTRMLRVVHNVSWRDNIQTKLCTEIYNQQKEKTQTRRPYFPGQELACALTGYVESTAWSIQ